MRSDPGIAFVLGTGRCGSTLVHEVLARHPAVGFLTNLEDRLPLPPVAGRFNNELFRRVPVRFTQKGRIRFAPSEGYRALERGVSPILCAPQRDLVPADVTPWLEKRTRRFFADRARAQGRPVFLHKFTGWPRAGFLGRIFPEAKFVHVVRDGRAVANSFLQMPWWRGYEGPEAWGWGPLPPSYADEWAASDRSFALLAGIEWKILIDAFEAAKAEVPAGRWLELRYEDFVAAPRDVTGEILSFLDLDWDPGFEEGFARYAFETGRRDAFRRDLGINDIAALDASLAGHLARFGYAVRGGDREMQSPAEGGRS